jgi:hypothetical protein
VESRREVSSRGVSNCEEASNLPDGLLLIDTISIQLLLLRLIVLFGGTDIKVPIDDKQTGVFTLCHKETGSVLDFHDFKGAGDMKLQGTEAGRKEAFKLLGCLTSFDMLYLNDGLRVGDAA